MKQIPVSYSPKVLADSLCESPSASKPSRVIESWKRLNIPIRIVDTLPVHTDEIKLVHGVNYVDQVLACNKDNGFGNRSKEVAASLPYTTGALVEAAIFALINKKVGVAPVAGFHHAHEHYGKGFCTFNGLVITALIMLRDFKITKVGILDFDYHYGDGTADIIRSKQLNEQIVHYSAGAEYHGSFQAESFFSRLPHILEKFTDCGLILYQAGADVHVDDPLGGFLTTEQIYLRDKTVFTWAHTHGIPVAWDLAGGYQESLRDVLDIHDNTLKACWEVYGDA
jgi:acetoin utilization deacetylase AcuC-like enzyme